MRINADAYSSSLPVGTNNRGEPSSFDHSVSHHRLLHLHLHRVVDVLRRERLAKRSIHCAVARVVSAARRIPRSVHLQRQLSKQQQRMRMPRLRNFCNGYVSFFLPIQWVPIQFGSPTRFINSAKRGSDRRLSSAGSTFSQIIQIDRSSHALLSHRNASSVRPNRRYNCTMS